MLTQQHQSVCFLKVGEGAPLVGRKRVPGARDRAAAGQLPPTDQVVHPVGRVAAEQLALAHREIVVPVPAGAVYWLAWPSECYPH